MTANDHVSACRECGQPASANYMSPTRERMLRDQLCFSCLYWIEIIEGRKNPQVAIAGGRYYIVHPYVERAGSGQSLGFGGARFHFRFKDGRDVRSNDVWNGSEIPARFRARLPDNAVLLGEDDRAAPKAAER